MNLHLITASAGTGKTERLSRVVADALIAEDASRIAVEGLIAVTYTRKAESELKARIRQTLIKRGKYDEAQRLPLAYVGTVHAICHRLLSEFAISAGLSPTLDVLPDDASDRALAEVFERVLSPEEFARFDEICARLRPNFDNQLGRRSWLADAQDLIELARSNRIAADALPAMAERSIEGYARVLGARKKDGKRITEDLVEQIDAALAYLGQGDGQANTTGAIKKLRLAKESFRTPETVPWALWSQLTEVGAAAAHRDAMSPVEKAAARHREHPLFHDDIYEYTRLVYAAVQQGLIAYSRWKEERRYIDYVDMEERALDLLDKPEVANSLKERLQLLIVDEFQDTSPIQLALFLKLEHLCNRSVWVGDRKQSIFAFRGADPALMDAVVDATERSGKKTEILSTNYRSRKGLVDFTSDIFTRSFGLHGYAEEQVRVAAKRAADDARMAELPAFGVWMHESTRVEDDAESIAEGVRKLLERPQETPVIDRASGVVRDVRASDVAILVSTNDEAMRLATALGARRILAAVPRKGLLETPEGTFLHAALRLVMDERDAAARATLVALTDFDGGDSDGWLARAIAAVENDTTMAAGAEAAAVDAFRRYWIQFAPLEAVDRLIGELDLARKCAQWPRPEERLANLEAFRALAMQYEQTCDANRAAGSLLGFLHFLGDAASGRTERDREDDQHAGGANAVEISTYHRSKGLEWPVVILAGLGSKNRSFGVPPDAATLRLARGGRSPNFSAVPESDAATFDPNAPLSGRWLRFWPWPYGGLQKTDLADRVAATPEAARVFQQAARESLRLLYVGFTRARDHLIIAARVKREKQKAAKAKAGAASKPAVTHKVDWLDTINDGKETLLLLPTGDDPVQPLSLRGGTTVQARVTWLTTANDATAAPVVVRNWHVSETTRERVSYSIAPSKAAEVWPEVGGGPTASAQMHAIGSRMPVSLVGAAMDEFGNAVHAFFAADSFDRPTEERAAIAEHILATNGFSSSARASDLVAAHDRLRDFVNKRFPDARWLREVPVCAKVGSPDGSRRVGGSIDLLLETPAGFVIIDHKSYPGTDWQAQAHHHSAQLAAYKHVIELGGAKVLGTFLHFPISGMVVE